MVKYFSYYVKSNTYVGNITQNNISEIPISSPKIAMEFAVRSSSVKFNDPKIKNEIFVRIDMKHSYSSQTIWLQSIFSVDETVVVCQKLNHVYA